MLVLKAPTRYVLAGFLAGAIIFAPKISLILFCLWALTYFIRQPLYSLKCVYRNPVSIFVALYFIWALSSIFWSIEPQYGFKSSAGSLALALTALGMGYFLPQLSAEEREQIFLTFKWTFAFALLTWCVEMITGGLVFDYLFMYKVGGRVIHGFQNYYKPSSFVMCGLSLIFLGWLVFSRQYLTAFLLVLATLFLSRASFSTTSSIGYLIGLITFGGCAALPTLFPRLLFILFLPGAVLLPLGLYLLPVSDYGQFLYHNFGWQAASFYHRTAIWEFSLSKWLEKPFHGWGVASSRSIPGGETKLEFGGQVLSLHPHNYIMQSGLELGLIGVILHIASLVAIMWMIQTRLKKTLSKATAYSVFMAVFVFCSGEHSLWHHWWVAWMCLFMSLTIVTCYKMESYEAE